MTWTEKALTVLISGGIGVVIGAAIVVMAVVLRVLCG